MPDNTPPPDPALVLDLLEAFRRSKTMFAAVSLGVFDALTTGPLRIADLACLIVLARYLLPSSEVFRRSLFARPVVLCGQNSLITYCIGGLLAIAGTLTLSATPGGLGWQALVNGIGWSGCVGAAWLWSRCKDRWGHSRLPAPQIADPRPLASSVGGRESAGELSITGEP